MNMDMVNQIVEAIMPYVVMVVTAVAGYVAVTIKNKLAEKLDTQTKKDVAEATVNYIQQVYEALDGKAKMEMALDTATQWLNEKGIKVSETELTILLEAAIRGAKEGWATQKIAENDLIISSAQASQIAQESTAVEAPVEEEITNEAE